MNVLTKCRKCDCIIIATNGHKKEELICPKCRKGLSNEEIDAINRAPFDDWLLRDYP